MTLKWLKGAIRPVTYLYLQFVYFRNRIVYELRITPQICYMEKALNDRWDVSLRRIYITAGPQRNPLILHRKIELKHEGFFTKSEGQHKLLWTKSEVGNYGVDFIINIPLLLPFDIDELNAFVEEIKLVTKTYRVQLY